VALSLMVATLDMVLLVMDKAKIQAVTDLAHNMVALSLMVVMADPLVLTQMDSPVASGASLIGLLFNLSFFTTTNN
jgi:hypothetical protein